MRSYHDKTAIMKQQGVFSLDEASELAAWGPQPSSDGSGLGFCECD